MNVDKLKAANDKFDMEFNRLHPDFVKWWSYHPHCDPIERWRISPRAAWKVKSYYEEFLEYKNRINIAT